MKNRPITSKEERNKWKSGNKKETKALKEERWRDLGDGRVVLEGTMDWNVAVVGLEETKTEWMVKWTGTRRTTTTSTALKKPIQHQSEAEKRKKKRECAEKEDGRESYGHKSQSWKSLEF